MYFRSQKKSSQDVSLSDCIETGSDGGALSLMDVVSDEFDLLEQVCSRELLGKLAGAMERCLSEQEKQVLRLRFGLGGREPLRQRQVAQMTGVSRSYVSRIEKRALEKLRKELDG